MARARIHALSCDFRRRFPDRDYLAWVHFPESRFHGPDLAGRPPGDCTCDSRDDRWRAGALRRLAHHQHLARLDTRNYLLPATRPPDLQRVRSQSLGYAEVHAEVAGGRIADARRHHVPLPAPLQPRSDTVAVGL